MRVVLTSPTLCGTARCSLHVLLRLRDTCSTRLHSGRRISLREQFLLGSQSRFKRCGRGSTVDSAQIECSSRSRGLPSSRISQRVAGIVPPTPPVVPDWVDFASNRNDWLTAVADADGRGRRCADPADQARIVDHCALWAEHCRELGVLDAPRRFPTPHTRRVWLESAPGARSPDVPAYDDTAGEVILMAGLPASGKDSWLRTHRPDLPVISLDRLRGELDVDPDDAQSEEIAAAREQARRYLREGTSFAWNATNLTPALRAQLLELFRGYRARTHIVYCEAGPDDLLTRNRSREARVPAWVIDHMIERWTVPDPAEAHAVTYAIAPGPGGVTWPPTPQI